MAATFVDEGESAKTADRPELHKLMTYCRENKRRVRAVIVNDVSRFARNHYDHAVLRGTLARLGITLRAVMQPIDDSPTGRLMEGVLAAFAQFDNDTDPRLLQPRLRRCRRCGS